MPVFVNLFFYQCKFFNLFSLPPAENATNIRNCQFLETLNFISTCTCSVRGYSFLKVCLFLLALNCGTLRCNYIDRLRYHYTIERRPVFALNPRLSRSERKLGQS